MANQNESSKNQATSTFDLRRELDRMGRSIADGWTMAGADLRNAIRRMRRARLDYVVLPVGGPLPERSGPPRSFIERRLPLPADPLSLQQLNSRLRAVADAGNVRGVVFIFRGFSAGLASLQNFRSAVNRLREAGKEVIVYTPRLDLAHYYAATAADRIIVPPGAHFEVLGLYTEVTFLKDALARVGVQAEIVQISPYKTAMDRFGRSEMSPEHREQLDWLLDDQFDMLTADMAAGRGIEQATLQRIIDGGPLNAEAARAAGLVDEVAYDDELPRLLARPKSPTNGTASGTVIPENETPSGLGESSGARTGSEATLKSWSQARPMLMERPRRRLRRFIGVISLEGLIVMGASRRPPIELPIPFLGEIAAGEQTVVGLLRRAEKLDDMAALVFHVDSGGGSALASDLIGRQLERLAAKKPVVVYMGNLAASGGYFVAAPATHIMSQRSTLTGSIGVIQAKVNTQGLYERLDIHRETVERGEHAGLYRDPGPLSDEERRIFWRMINEIYQQFKTVVAKGRELTEEEVDAIGGGRVWTGRQAIARRLVDSHGDFYDAIKKAAELAALPAEDIFALPVVNLYARSSAYVPPATKPARAIEELAGWLAGREWRELAGQPLLLSPYDLRFR